MEDLTSPFLLNLRPFSIRVLEIITDMAYGCLALRRTHRTSMGHWDNWYLQDLTAEPATTVTTTHLPIASTDFRLYWFLSQMRSAGAIPHLPIASTGCHLY